VVVAAWSFTHGVISALSSRLFLKTPPSARERAVLRLAKPVPSDVEGTEAHDVGFIVDAVRRDNSGCLYPTVAARTVSQTAKEMSRSKPDRLFRQSPSVRYDFFIFPSQPAVRTRKRRSLFYCVLSGHLLFESHCPKDRVVASPDKARKMCRAP
jgi:hypothetical protein